MIDSSIIKDRSPKWGKKWTVSKLDFLHSNLLAKRKLGDHPAMRVYNFYVTVLTMRELLQFFHSRGRVGHSVFVVKIIIHEKPHLWGQGRTVSGLDFLVMAEAVKVVSSRVPLYYTHKKKHPVGCWCHFIN